MWLRVGCVFLLCSAAFQAQEGAGDARVQQLYTQAKAAQQQGDIGGAIAKYEEIVQAAPRLAAAYNNLGALYFRQRDFAKAAKVLEEGLKWNPGMTSAKALLGISLYEMGEYSRARPHLEAALHANPADKNAELYLIHDLSKLDDFEGAADHLRRRVARDPNDQEAWYLLAKVHMKLSEAALARMNAIDPHSALAHELSGEMMEAMNNYDGAIVELKKAVETAPRRAGTHYKLGEAYMGLSQLEAARTAFQAELAVDPANCRARWRLGAITLQQNGPPEQALAEIDRGLASCPAMTEARLDRARALMGLNRPAEAATELEAAVKADPAEPSTHFLLARVYRTLGRTQEAQAEMQTYSRLEEKARAAVAERAQEVIQNKQSAH